MPKTITSVGIEKIGRRFADSIDHAAYTLNGTPKTVEPFRKLVNQGMIQGRSNFVYRVKGTNRFVSLGLKDRYDTQEIHVDFNMVRGDVLDLEACGLQIHHHRKRNGGTD